jgi:hypothetical protein
MENTKLIVRYNVIKGIREQFRLPMHQVLTPGTNWNWVSEAEIFFCGGMFHHERKCRVFNFATEELAKVKSMIEGRSDHALATSKKQYYVFGGLKTRKCEMYDDGAWQMLPELPIQLDFANAELHD